MRSTTLIEILIGIVISIIIMGAMYASYTAINNSYSQVTDKAKRIELNFVAGGENRETKTNQYSKLNQIFF